MRPIVDITTLALAHTDEVIRDNLSKYPRFRIPAIKKFLKSGTILDFGCGSGEFMKVLEDYSYDAYGYEPSKKAVERAKQYFHFDSNHITNKLEEINKKFDAAYLGSVLQYSPNKSKTLDLVITKTKNKGYIFIEFPNTNSLYNKILGTKTPKEWMQIPKMKKLQYIATLQGTDSYNSIEGLFPKKILRKLFSVFEVLLWIFNIKIATHYICVFRVTV